MVSCVDVVVLRSVPMKLGSVVGPIPTLVLADTVTR